MDNGSASQSSVNLHIESVKDSRLNCEKVGRIDVRNSNSPPKGRDDQSYIPFFSPSTIYPVVSVRRAGSWNVVRHLLSFDMCPS